MNKSKRNDVLANLIFAVIIVSAFGVIIGFRVWQAVHVYHDSRCIYSECRLNKQ